jgi:hypothetical protein
VVPGCWVGEESVTLEIGRGIDWDGGTSIEDCNEKGDSEGGAVGGIGTLVGCTCLGILEIAAEELGEGKDTVTACFTSSLLDAAWSCNKAVMPRAEGALWYLDIDVGEPCKELEYETGADREVCSPLWDMILDWADRWRATCNSWGSIFFLTTRESRDGSKEGIDCFPQSLNVGLLVIVSEAFDSDFRFSGVESSNKLPVSAVHTGTVSNILWRAFDTLICWNTAIDVGLLTLFSEALDSDFSFSEVESGNKLPVSAVWTETASNLPWRTLDAVICWSTFSAASAFGSSQSTLLKISWTLANASTGSPSFSSIPVQSIEIREAAAFISEKRTLKSGQVK